MRVARNRNATAVGKSILPRLQTLGQMFRTWTKSDPWQRRVILDGSGSAAFHDRSTTIQGSLEEVLDVAISKSWFRHLAQLEVVIPLCQCLVLRRDLPRVARSRQLNILSLELERSAPFARDEILFDAWMTTPTQKNEREVQATLIAAKRSSVETLFQVTRDKRIAIHSIRVQASDGTVLPIDLLNSAPRLRRRGVVAYLNSMLLAAGLLAASLYILNLYSTTIQLDELLVALDAQIDRQVPKVAIVKKSQGLVAAVSDAEKRLKLKNRSAISFMHSWDELTRLLPDSAWVTDLRLEGDQLHFGGFAQSATALVPVLASSGLFTSPNFVAPIQMDTTANAEAFQIRVAIRP